MPKMGKNLNTCDTPSSPSIMEPMDSLTIALIEEEINEGTDKMPLPDASELVSINYFEDHTVNDTAKSFLLMDNRELLNVSSEEKFCQKLYNMNNYPDTKLKVVSIFGNTGDGKSHTLNHTFFHGEEVFRTSCEQKSCTLGVWAAVQPKIGVLCLDTEGLLGVTSTENQRTRMLLKVLAISDIVIYRTRSERLHSDMFTFLGTASKAFSRHFSSALQSLGLPGPPQHLGPAVIIFHETRNTKPFESSVAESTEELLRRNFGELHIDLEAFSSLRYVGVRSQNCPTNYGKLKSVLSNEIENTTVRSARPPSVIFKAIQALNKKFCGEIAEKPLALFPEEYFTCGMLCESCNERCERSMGHLGDNQDHHSAKRCQYQSQYENKVFICKNCYANGKEEIVNVTSLSNTEGSWRGLAKFAWSGSVIDCPKCGEIFRTRQYWYGNKSPEDEAVRGEIVHVWKGGPFSAKGINYSAQMVIDSVSFVTTAVSRIVETPSRAITDKLADSIAPTYWRPNNEIIKCSFCRVNFEKTGLSKHHCRRCGEGFCSSCSKHFLPVPTRGWYEPVRVCNDCRDALVQKSNERKSSDTDRRRRTTSGETSTAGEEPNVIVRKIGEAVLSTLSPVTALIDYSKDFIKDTARPGYWVPDDEAPNCEVCNMPFGTADELAAATSSLSLSCVSESPDSPFRSFTGASHRTRHHCRACGGAVCNPCSLSRRPVPKWGWTNDVRVCNKCYCN